MDSFLQQSITSAVTSAVAITVTAIQAKNKNKILSLWERIEKFLLLKKSPSASSFLNSDATPKAYLGSNSLPKTTIER